MDDRVVAWLAFVCPALFGAAMGLVAYWVFNLSAGRHSPEGFGKTVAWVVGWMVGNGATLVGGVMVVSPADALQGLPRAALLIAMGYLAGFGVGIICVYCFGHKTDQSIVGRLQLYLNGQQLETILLMYRYGVNDVEEAAKRMGLSAAEFSDLHLEAMRILHQRAKTLISQFRSN